MATFVEAGFFGYFNSVFIFLFVLVVMYAILTATKILGGNAAINAVAAFVVAIVFASSSFASKTFEYATPWLVMLFVLILFINLMIKFIGGEKTFWFGDNRAVVVVIIVFIVVIFLLAAGQVSKESKQAAIDAGENPTLSFAGRVGETLRHPAILGLIMVLLIAVFAIILLTRS